MARKPRVHFPGAYYHVMLRGNNRNQIFFSNTDRHYFYALIYQGIIRYEYKVHAFCLMDNHVHFAIQVGEVALSKIIHNISFRYTQYINKQQEKIGHLFQGRFKAILIDADSYLLSLIKYIHLNPVRANIVSDPDKYIWSSHRAYLGIDKIEWLTTDYILNYFGNDRKLSVCQFSDFIQKKVASDLNAAFQKGSQPKYSILGDDDFLCTLNLSGSENSESKITLDCLIEIICSYFFIGKNSLLIRSHQHAKIRAIIAYFANYYNLSTYANIASYFNLDATGLIRAANRLKHLPSKELLDCKILLEKSVCQA